MSYQQDPDYIEVPERVKALYEKYPDARISCPDYPSTVKIGEQEFIIVHAQVYRTPDDPHPGDGWAWEPVPGTTPFTRNSELMNAQTAAIGRAIVSVGLLASRKIASKEEVEARKAEQEQAKKAPVKKKGGSGNGKLPAKSVKLLEEQVRPWLDRNPDLHDEFRLQIIALGVVDPNKSLADVLGQLPSDKAGAELLSWLGANGKKDESE